MSRVLSSCYVDETIQEGGNQALNGPAFAATTNLDFTLTSNTILRFQSKNFDTNNNFITQTSFRPTVPGYYKIIIYIQVSNLRNMSLQLIKNSDVIREIRFGNSVSFNISALVYLNGLGDTVYCITPDGGSTTQLRNVSYIQGYFVRGP